MAITTLTPDSTTYISEYFPDSNFIETSELYIGRYSGIGDIYRSLLKFRFESIPNNVIVNSAILRLYINRKDIPDGTLTPQPLNVYSNLENFDANEITWNKQPSVSSSIANYNITDSDLNNYIDINITSLVQSWLNGSIPNTGIMLQGVESSDSLIGITNLNDNSYNFWPQLVLDYTIDNVTIYPTETLSFTGATTLRSASIPFTGRTDATFNVAISGVGAGTASIELSNDDTNWINDNSVPAISIPSFERITISTSSVAKYVRLKLQSTGIMNATVTPVVREQ